LVVLSVRWPDDLANGWCVVVPAATLYNVLDGCREVDDQLQRVYCPLDMVKNRRFG